MLFKKSTKTQWKIRILLVIVYAIGLVIYLVFIKEQDSSHYHQFTEIKPKDSLENLVISTNIDRNAIEIILNDSSKWFTGLSKNHNYATPEVIYFIRAGDSLFKRPNSDTLFIYRNDNEYYFRFRKEILKGE